MQRWLWPSSTTNFAVSASAATLQETLPESPSWPVSWGPTMWSTYAVQAHYAGGNSAWSPSVPLEPDGPFSAALVAGQQGLPYLAIANVPSTTTALRVTQIDAGAIIDFGDTSLDTQWDIPVSQSADGIYPMPTNAVAADAYGLDDYQWWVQTVNSNNGLSAGAWLTSSYNPATNAAWMAPPFFDGRRQMKQNLNFLLRVANAAQTFGYTVDGGGNAIEYEYPTNYAFAGLYDIYDPNTGSDLADLNQLRPFQENYLYYNFVFSTANLNPDGTLAGVGWGGQPFPVFQSPPAYQFQPPSNSAPIPAILDPNAQRWTCLSPLSSPGGDLSLIDVTDPYYLSPAFYMTNTQPNYFGLPFLSAHFAYTNASGMEFSTLYAGGSTPAVSGGVFQETATNGLQTVAYYFARPGTDPLPGQAEFSSTNTTAQPMIVGFTSPDPNFGSQPFEIAGYAKQVLLNGYSNVFGYLGQYFDQAYVIDTNGMVTTNPAGFLSPYGDFVPTMPGPTALVTMPDVDTGQRGTGVVNVIKLQLDVNHDGTMDPSFAGPDNTSQGRPFVFWINNDNDGTGIGQDVPVAGSNVEDYRYGQIRSWRNLEDFARLWVCGLPKLPAAEGYAMTLSMSPLSGSPAINLYAQFDPTGGTGYLTDTNAARAQFTQGFLNGQLGFDYSKTLGSISLTQTWTLPVKTDGTALYTNFLFEGAGIGVGQLMLSIWQTTIQGSNLIAQTSAWVDLHDIKDMYERLVVTNITTGAIGNWSSAIEAIQYPTVSDPGETKDIIVFVHGINNTVPNWLISSETMFKRLYWSGYHGKFMSVRWPCLYLFPNAMLDPFQFNRSEFQAYLAATAFKTYLQELRSQFPDYRIHIVAHSQGNAMASEALKQGAPFDTYVLTQAAMPASSYDVNAATNSDLIYQESLEPTPQWQPMGYRGAYTNFTGQIDNLYNPQDYALRWWFSGQKINKPDGIPGARNYTSDGTNGFAIIDVGLYRLVTDSRECRSMVSRARTLAIGAQGPASGQTAEGVIGTTVDLNAQFGFFDTRVEHSAEFTRPIQACYGYYLRLLNLLQP